MFGIVASALNAASKANIVTSTAFTGLQTVATGYLSSDSKDLIDPNSYEEIQKSKKALRESFVSFNKKLNELSNYETDIQVWKGTYNEAEAEILNLKFHIFEILPYEKKKNDTPKGAQPQQGSQS